MPVVLGGTSEQLPLTLGDLRLIFERQVGHDLPQDEADRIINEAYRQLVGQSKWLTAEVELGVTTAGAGRYPVPSNVVDLEGVRVGDSYTYRRVGTTELWNVKAGSVQVAEPGVFAPAFNEQGDSYVELHPAPETSGDPVVALAAILPPALTSAADVPKVPADFHGDIIRGAQAILLERNEEHIGEAAALRAEFREAIGRLTLRKNSRIGSGPSQIQVRGYHF